VVANRLYSAFGATVAASGGPWMPFGWMGDGASQTDADTGLVLMGHRYYDSRTGRFISQDPAGDGDNWYGYCGNDPMDEADPEGLSASPNPNAWSVNGSTEADGNWAVGNIEADSGSTRNLWNEANHIWIVNYSPGVKAGAGEDGYNTGSEIDRVNWAVPGWNQGFMMAGTRPPGIPNRTWKQALLGTLGAMGAALTLGGGAVHPGVVPHEVIPVAVEQAKPDKREEKEEKSGGSLYSLMRSTHKAYMATENFLESITYQIGRLKNQSGGLGVPIFSGAGGGVLAGP